MVQGLGIRKPFKHMMVKFGYIPAIRNHLGRLIHLIGHSVPETFQKFCDMLPEGCFAWDDASERNPYFRNPKNRLFYYLVAAFTMFILEEPGHPVGMPFPGGFKVEQRGREYYCLIRDKEKEIFYSICNFCPALQSEDNKKPE